MTYGRVWRRSFPSFICSTNWGSKPDRFEFDWMVASLMIGEERNTIQRLDRRTQTIHKTTRRTTTMQNVTTKHTCNTRWIRRKERSRRADARSKRKQSIVRSDAASTPNTDVPSEAGRASYRPNSYKDLVEDAIRATCTALERGYNRIEVDYPSLPNAADSYSGASDDYVDANVQQAIAAGRWLRETKGWKSHIVVPDNEELNRSYNMFKSALELEDGISMGSLTGKVQGFGAAAWEELSFLFGAVGRIDEKVLQKAEEACKVADVFFFINASTIELPEIESYVDRIVGDRPALLWNLELDTLRSDLGLFGFPSKDVHYRFLSQFLPAFYIRQRDYSKSVSVAPFLINYSGALFREYPGPWQVMLRQDGGLLACVAEDKERLTLFDFKEELLKAMGLDTEEKGSTLEFLRRGYKTATWWEEDVEQESSSNWRS